MLFQSVAPAENFNLPGDRLVAANDSLAAANNSLAAANDGLVGANNKKGETKQQETDAHLFENQRSEPTKREAAWIVCTSEAIIAAVGTKKTAMRGRFPRIAANYLMLDEPSRAAGKRRVVISYQKGLLDGQRKARREGIILRSILALGANETGAEGSDAHSATFDREG